MKPTRSDDDEPDVIDLTACYGCHGALSFPIRPPSPFADPSPDSEPFCRDHEFHAMMTWSEPAKQQSLTYKINNTERPTLSSSYNYSSSQTNSKWRRTLSRLLKRAKSVERKQANPCMSPNVNHLYDFGLGENAESDAATVRSGSHKRVHWFDEEEARRNECYRFVEYLKLAVRTIRDGKNGDYYLEACRESLHQLQSLVNYPQLEQGFENLIQLAKKRDKRQLIKQQKYLESLLFRTSIPSA